MRNVQLGICLKIAVVQNVLVKVRSNQGIIPKHFVSNGGIGRGFKPHCVDALLSSNNVDKLPLNTVLTTDALFPNILEKKERFTLTKIKVADSDLH